MQNQTNIFATRWPKKSDPDLGWEYGRDKKTSLHSSVFIFDPDHWYLVNFDVLTKRFTKTCIKQKKSMSHKRPPVRSVYFICIRHMLILYNPLCDKFLPPSLHFLSLCLFLPPSLEECITTAQTRLFVHNFPRFTTKVWGGKNHRSD